MTNSLSELWGWGEFDWKYLKGSTSTIYIVKFSSEDETFLTVITKAWCAFSFLDNFREANEQ